jgi:hypothetical protein
MGMASVVLGPRGLLLGVSHQSLPWSSLRSLSQMVQKAETSSRAVQDRGDDQPCDNGHIWTPARHVMLRTCETGPRRSPGLS